MTEKSILDIIQLLGGADISVKSAGTYQANPLPALVLSPLNQNTMIPEIMRDKIIERLGTNGTLNDVNYRIIHSIVDGNVVILFGNPPSLPVGELGSFLQGLGISEQTKLLTVDGPTIRIGAPKRPSILIENDTLDPWEPPARYFAGFKPSAAQQGKG